MVKDIIVNLSVTKEGSVVGDYAVSAASALQAHLTAVGFIYDAVVPISGAGYIPAEVIEIQRDDNKTAAEAAIKSFNRAADQAGISAEPLMTNASLAGAGDHFARMARRFDLAIVGQGQPDNGSVEQIIGETTLFESGRPVIMVPYIQQAPFKTDHVMICWDGSRTAARAVADAIPIIGKTSRVEIVIVASERNNQDEIEGADIGQHLARHELQVNVHRISGGNIDVGDALLSHAADSGADLVVMGGYGHSRLREFILGGVTRSIFQSMTVPVLLSH